MYDKKKLMLKNVVINDFPGFKKRKILEKYPKSLCHRFACSVDQCQNYKQSMPKWTFYSSF